MRAIIFVALGLFVVAAFAEEVAKEQPQQQSAVAVEEPVEVIEEDGNAGSRVKRWGGYGYGMGGYPSYGYGGGYGGGYGMGYGGGYGGGYGYGRPRTVIIKKIIIDRGMNMYG